MPIAGGGSAIVQARTNLIALRDARERAIELVSDRYAEGLFADDELELRLEQLEDARTLAEIDELTEDLLAPGTPPVSQALVPAERPAAAPARRPSPEPSAPARLTADQVPATENALAIFSAVERLGPWAPGRVTNATAIFGSTVLDFRSASLGPGVIEVNVTALFGSVEIIVPPDLPVALQVTPILGGVEADGGVNRLPGDPAAPSLLIRGAAIFGAVEIRSQLLGESRREARRRRRREHRQLRRSGHRARSDQNLLGEGDREQ